MERSKTLPQVEVQVVVHGEVPPDCVEQARTMVRKVTGLLRVPVLVARVRLSQGRDPAVRCSAVAQANLTLNGRPTRAHVAAGTMHEAIDLLQDRLAERVVRLYRHGNIPRSGSTWTAPHPWRHDGHEGPAPQPAQGRRVVRHKSYSLARETADEAAFEMEMMDYGFHLFTDTRSGQDAVIYRAGPTGYRVSFLRPVPEPAGPLAVPLTTSPIPAPRLTLAKAEERLELTGYPFVFFADQDSGRGHVVYRRLDGQYGLITPAA